MLTGKEIGFILLGVITIIIYEAINKINNKRYIEQTVNSLEHRKRQHIETSKRNINISAHFYRALNKYGEDNFEWKIIEYCNTHEELDEKESFWIIFFNTTNPLYGYNLKGGGAKPYLTDEVKTKIGDSQRGELNHMFGRKGKDNPSSKRVINITTNETYDSVEELCENNPEYSHSKVCAVCRGDRKTHKGCVFRYLNESNEIIHNGNEIGTVEILVNYQTQERFTKKSYAINKYKKQGQDLKYFYKLLKDGDGICKWNGYIWYIEYIEY